MMFIAAVFCLLLIYVGPQENTRIAVYCSYIYIYILLYYYIKYCAEINVIITHRKDYGNYLNLYKTESKWVS